MYLSFLQTRIVSKGRQGLVQHLLKTECGRCLVKGITAQVFQGILGAQSHGVQVAEMLMRGLRRRTHHSTLSCRWLCRSSPSIRLLPLGVRNGQPSSAQSPSTPHSALQPSTAPHGPKAMGAQDQDWQEKPVLGPPARVTGGLLWGRNGRKTDVLGVEKVRCSWFLWDAGHAPASLRSCWRDSPALCTEGPR